MYKFTNNYLARLGAITICAMLALPTMAEIADGNPIPMGPVQLQCWQYGVKIIDEKGLQKMTTSSTRESGVMSFQRGEDLRGTVLVMPTPNGICLVKNER